MFISLIVGFLNIILFSFNFFKKIEYEYFLISLFIIVSPVPLLAYTNSILIKYYFWISFISILIFSLVNLRKRNFNILKILEISKNFIKNINFSILLYAFLVAVLCTFKFLPIFYRFEAHDLLYFSWLNDVFNIDYFGPIRVPTAYPFLLSANHLIPGSLLTPFLVFNKNINLFSTYIVKFLIIFYTILNFTYHYLSISYRKLRSNNFLRKIYPITTFLLFFFFYYSEIDYSLAISNYPFILLGLSICTLILKRNYLIPKNEEDQYKKNNFVFIFLLCCFLITKATLFPVIVFSTLLFVFVYGVKKTFNFLSSIEIKYNILILFIVLINFFSWILPSSNHGSLSLAFPFCLDIYSKVDNGLCINSFFRNPFSGWFIPGFKLDILRGIFLVRPLLEYAYIWLVCLLPCYLSAIIILKKSKNKLFRNFGKYLICYVLACSLSIISIRESTLYTGAHTAHSYLIAPIFTIISLIILYVNHLESKPLSKVSLFYLTLTLLTISTIFFFDDSTVLIRRDNLRISSVTGEKGLSLSYLESKKFDKKMCTKDETIIKIFGVLLDQKNCGNNDLGEIKHALEGKKSSISLSAENSIIRKWTLQK